MQARFIQALIIVAALFDDRIASNQFHLMRKDVENAQIRLFVEINKYILFQLLIMGKNWRLFIEKHLWLSVALSRKFAIKTNKFLPSGSKENA